MALPPRRWCNAVMVWIRNKQLDGGEEGRLRWEQITEYVHTPPARPAAGDTPEKPRSGPRAAIMTPEQEAAAFAAYAAATGG